MQTNFGIIGLGVMGKSLARNMANNGIELSLYNRYEKGVEENIANDFIGDFYELKDAEGFEDLTAFIQSLERPRKMLLMVKAGKAIDGILEKITPHLSEGDIIIDGGNSHYKDTERRIDFLKSKKIHFIGSGVSGGEEGALKGPSIMPGGDEKAYQLIAPYLEKIALIEVDFPKYTDGRGYSQAQLLRRRYGYEGELRAVGHVLTDQILYMHRSGFDAYETARADLSSVMEALKEYSAYYQPAADSPTSVFARRHS